LGLTHVIEDADGHWRIYTDTRPGLRPSPLFRSIWLKPIQREQLGPVLRPMRTWLQTCGLACGLESLSPLTHALFAAGVTRIARPGKLTQRYLGAPRDRVYALQPLTARVSLDGPDCTPSIARLAQWGRRPAGAPPAGPILTKQG